MRRALLIFLMWLVPFQAVWSAGHMLHGHLPDTATHVHVHALKKHEGPPRVFLGPLRGETSAASFSGWVHCDLVSEHGEALAHGDDGRHGAHGHAPFTCLIADLALELTDRPAPYPSPAPPASFTSHIPLLPDPPPAVRI
ncbi:MAG: hypothetical protein KGZ43_09315 [Sulfuritalea sp.]|nr:hypothetical protein [Sulfuritalea sp.]